MKPRITTSGSPRAGADDDAFLDERLLDDCVSISSMRRASSRSGTTTSAGTSDGPSRLTTHELEAVLPLVLGDLVAEELRVGGEDHLGHAGHDRVLVGRGVGERQDVLLGQLDVLLDRVPVVLRSGAWFLSAAMRGLMNDIDQTGSLRSCDRGDDLAAGPLRSRSPRSSRRCRLESA